MTVATTSCKTARFSGNGTTTEFAFTFTTASENDLVVTLADSDGVETVKTLTTHYTVALETNGTGTVTMLTAPASGETLVVSREVDLTQETDYTPQGAFNAETIESALDKVTRALQQIQEQLSRCPKTDITDEDTGEDLLDSIETDVATTAVNAAASSSSASAASGSASAASGSASAASGSASAAAASALEASAAVSSCLPKAGGTMTGALVADDLVLKTGDPSAVTNGNLWVLSNELWVRLNNGSRNILNDANLSSFHAVLNHAGLPGTFNIEKYSYTGNTDGSSQQQINFVATAKTPLWLAIQAAGQSTSAGGFAIYIATGTNYGIHWPDGNNNTTTQITSFDATGFLAGPSVNTNGVVFHYLYGYVD